MCFAVRERDGEVFFVGVFDSEQMCHTGFDIWTMSYEDIFSCRIRKYSFNMIDFEKESVAKSMVSE